jgi:hypothetical protein
MAGFWISALASLLAGVVVVIVTAAVSSRARWVLTGILGRLLDVDIDAVFTDKRAAEADVRKELARAREIAIFTGRGNELQRDTFDPVFLHRPAAKALRVRILLPRTDGSGEFDWTQQREEELSKFDRAFARHGLLKDQIETTARFLEGYVSTARVELRRFNCPHIGRIILTDRCAFFTPYRHDSHGRDCAVYKYRRGDLYENYTRLYEQLWMASDPTAPTLATSASNGQAV